MNRQAKREIERKLEKDRKFLGKLPKDAVFKINKLEKENINMNKLQEDFRNYITELIKGDMDKKEVIDKALFKFPKLSRTAISNTYAGIKDELEIEKAAAYVIEEVEEVEKIKEVKTKEIAKEKVGMKEVKGNKKTNESKLKIIESLVKVQGEHGIYTIENYKVKINDMEIGNIQEMDNFTKQLELEDGKKIEKLVQELSKVREDKIKELEEVIGMI